MLKKRIIPCLDIKDGKTVKGIQFEDLRIAGDPVELAKKYVNDSADELVFLDVTATLEGRKTLIELVEKLSLEINIPFTIGGGISSAQDVEALLKAGADKVSINSAAVRRPELVREIAQQFGNQCVVVAIDTKNINGEDYVFINGGKIQTQLKTLEWVKTVADLGAGELLLTSMDFDGTKNGFDIRMLQNVSQVCHLPIIASGGAGKMEDFTEVFTETKVTGALAASIFHFNEIKIVDLKENLKQNKISIR
ncbi:MULTISPECIES: imidazole glycerol phosphate synthase subunit HisF [unclassified Kaistella]|uniref:imidazole glycerol phosphate synthase subunit HisF n=1 Tax=unclassified Kaistella TaxID=2762626 RepID=UPI002737301E|nr:MULTISPECIES: imidazole glycerol phosphate synthase subunit HisF [unclassified Kaistella]MDP2454773.1 imidazole glycerol phosphate synthase subunit HisF [Kaistella sp. SH11-4b]MDP2457510.1 imidazole glycerol phosphate synthase subunit HisF [Kaistella sp. SH40-3]MDP2460270.1 imidazole glycerol phosphate synthase subunit HisF [Kaistella sp. SH19-2b]